MAFDNLPPGVTPGDIDDHYGGDPDEAYVTLNITIDVPSCGYGDDQMIADAREQVSDALRDMTGDVIEVEPVNIEPA